MARGTNSDHYSIEVLPFNEASWAPSGYGFDFQWAWRIRTDNGTTVLSGVSNGSRADAQTTAQTAAERLHAIQDGNNPYRISNGSALKRPASPTKNAADSDNDENGSD